MRTKKSLYSPAKINRRTFLKAAAVTSAAATFSACISKEAWEEFLQRNFRSLSKDKIAKILQRLEAQYSQKYGKKFSVSAKEPIPETLFGYGLDISRCIGCRKCVYGCVEENNQSRDPQTHWIQVLEMEKEKGIDFRHADLYYEHKEVPYEGHFYLPVACQQCKNPPCVKSCPVSATWTETDGIVVLDYNWCIGCRTCMAACPYGARYFNWGRVTLASDEVNPNTHYLGNRPRAKGVVEEVHFLYPASPGGPLSRLR